MSAVVRVKNARGEFIKARVLLDTCSTAHFVTEKFARELGLPAQECSVPVGAINGLSAVAKKEFKIKFYSRTSDCERTLTFLAIPSIAERVPEQTFPRHLFNIPTNLKLADPQFQVPRAIDMLIGSGVTLAFLLAGQLNFTRDNHNLVLQKTQLGWVAAGGPTELENAKDASCYLTKLGDQLTRFWEIEEVGLKRTTTNENEQCERHYAENTMRNASGRYVVKLPFASERPDLGNSRQHALRRFYALQRKLRSNEQLNSEYSKTMQEYITLGHMTLVQNEFADNSGIYYLPHHAVIKTSSATTKVRVVFDASAKTDRGVSLNDCLLVGPTIQDKIFGHLTRFRSYAYVLTADIEKMYRQVLVHPEDRCYQRVFWMHNDNIAAYELNTVTFGVAAAPFLAIRTLHQLADDEKHDFPRAAKIIKRDLYVDDLLTGANSLEEILLIRDEIIALLRRGGFNIRQWASNHKHALDTLDEKIIELDCAIEERSVSKTLGVAWDSHADSLIYSINAIEIPEKITKRHILSEIAKIFDPMGLLGPVSLYAKNVIQTCWKEERGWDDEVSRELGQTWAAFAKQLSLIQGFAIERRLLLDDPSVIEIHGFCDASEDGYGACLYVRSINKNSLILSRLACAKSRVAPLKKKTIPQLELCGALILVRLFVEARKAFDFPIDKVIFWSDSSIVLCWLKKSPSVLKVFEANRVSEIQALDAEVEWRHVRTRDNPADALSRGQAPLDFLQNGTWLHGPAWLERQDSEWPVSNIILPREVPGIRKGKCLAISVKNEIFPRFSSFNRMVRVIAICLRWHKGKEFRGKRIGVDEKIAAENLIIRAVQREQFAEEIARLSKSLPPKNSRIAALDPILDEQNILRVGGRLIGASIPYAQKHPILLPSYHHVTDMLIRETHLDTYHAGIQTTLYTMRLRFWLLDGKNQVRKIVRSCVTCIRNRPQLIQSKMGDLPRARVRESGAFSHIGIDFFGPIYIKEKKFRNRQRVKSYGCIFVCMATKAVHIEIVSDLTTEGFLGGLKRFIGRRGVPTDVFSDNGTNFVGANSQLQEMYTLLNSNEFRNTVDSFALKKNITWHFSPPLSPHFGGLWEAAVKSFKHHFKRVIGEQLLTFEEVNTLAIEIEAILNSRPLYSISTDPNDPLAITPAHILLGRPLTSLPETDYSTVTGNCLSAWRFITKARQDFWKRWYLEYLNELQRRQKWSKSNHDIGVGTVVLLIEKNQPCMRWQMGVVVETHPGGDGIVRVVTVKTAQSKFKRNVTQLCPLPTNQDN